MRHAAAFCSQFPVTRLIASSSFTIHRRRRMFRKKLLATNREILNYYRFIKAFAFFACLSILRDFVLLFR